MKSIIVLSFVILSTLLFSALTSCSDDNPAAPEVTPSVQIEVLTPSPEVGQPVLFKATVSGVTLTAPMYEWDFGDGSNQIVSDNDTISHIYFDKGPFLAIIHITDNMTHAHFTDTVDVSVVDNTNPVWQEWNSVTVSVFGEILYSWTGAPPASTITNDTLIFSFGSFGGLHWNNLQLEYDSVFIASMDDYKSTFHVNLSKSGFRLDSLTVGYGSSHHGMGSSGSSKYAKIRGLSLIGTISSDSAIYRADGDVARDAILSCSESRYSSNSSGYSLSFYHPTPDSWVEVRFYKK